MRLGIVEPQDAVAAFERRGLDVRGTFHWQDVWQEEHSRAFAVAGIARGDLLQQIYAELDGAVRDGRSFEQFARAVRPRLVEAGFWGDVQITDQQTGEQRISRFDQRRLFLIYDTNVRQSMASGQWARIQRTKDRMPFIMYRTAADERVRASHQAWHGLVLPVDHPFWQTHFPPNGWRCRCKAFAIDAKGVERYRSSGQPVNTDAPDVRWMNVVNARTGEITPVPHGVDPGFAYNPGMGRDQAMYDAVLRKAAGQYPLAAASTVAQVLADRPAFVSATTAEFGGWVAQVMRAQQPAGEIRWIGALKPSVVRALIERGVEPVSAAVGVRDLDVLHALLVTPGKAAAGAAIDASVYASLPELLERASAILLDTSRPQQALLYVVDIVIEDGSVAKCVLNINMPVRTRVDGARAKLLANIVRTATVMDPQALQDRVRYELIWGRLE